MPNSVYIHIPFCKSKCKYCSFVSFNNPELITGYIYSLMKEISDNYRGEKLGTLYFGGGTPSLVPADLITKVIKKFNILDNCEITFELNPDDAELLYLQRLHEAGVNRISIGSQTFDNDLLKLIGRRHDSSQIINAVELSKKAGFENISADLIYGLPNQNMDSIKADIEKFLSLEIKHISTYGLKIEQNSYFGKNPPQNLPSDDEQADMYEMINNRLEMSGYKRYEVSNFAREGYESKHNLTYWNNEEYYGFGVSAHGYEDGVRYSNYSEIEKYMENPSSHEYGKFLTEQEKLEEEIFLGFRKTEGISIKKIKDKYSVSFEDKYASILEKYSDYIEKTPSGYALNLKGTLLSNEILSEFIQL
ncbi:radical SAM family heme chaperone HemW [bacterium]|nr:radical SAM family heme chaperone HemW [bacterium]